MRPELRSQHVLIELGGQVGGLSEDVVSNFPQQREVPVVSPPEACWVGGGGLMG